MIDLDAIFDPDRPLPAWSAGPKSSTAVPPTVRVEDLDGAAPPAVRAGDLPPDWHFLWDERAAIREYDGGLPPASAEALALAEIIQEMERAAASPRGDA